MALLEQDDEHAAWVWRDDTSYRLNVMADLFSSPYFMHDECA